MLLSTRKSETELFPSKPNFTVIDCRKTKFRFFVVLDFLLLLLLKRFLEENERKGQTNLAEKFCEESGEVFEATSLRSAKVPV